MHLRWLAVAALSLLAQQALAQQATTNTPPALDPANNRLDAVLMQWQQKMQNVQTLLVPQLGRSDVDKTFRVTTNWQGTAKYMKPGLALLEMYQRDRPQVYEKYICTGTFLYQFVPSDQIVRVMEMPPPKPGQMADDNFLALLFSTRADEARRRYDIRLVKEDQYYVYLEIFPRFPNDKADFQRARLALNNQSFLPRSLWFEQPNGNEINWDIPRLEINARLNRAEFTSPALPPNWRLVRVPRDLPPRIVRPNQ